MTIPLNASSPLNVIHYSTPTDNLTSVIIGWLKEGDYVVTYAPRTPSFTMGINFHNCKGDIKTKTDQDDYIEKTRIIFFNVKCALAYANSQCDEVQEIKDAGFLLCSCSLKARINNVYMEGPHVFHLAALPHEHKKGKQSYNITLIKHPFDIH